MMIKLLSFLFYFNILLGFSQEIPTPFTNNQKVVLGDVRDYYLNTYQNLSLTIAVGAAPDKMDDVEWNLIAPLVDIINLMSYDFFGTFDPITNHNSPLYAPAQGDPEFNVDKSVQRLINNYGVNPNQITVSVAFYGRSHKTVGAPGLHVAGTGTSDNVVFQADLGTPMYYSILDSMHLFDKHWDTQAEVPYITGKGSLQTFVSYDDKTSIARKAEYIIDNNLRGAIIWEITGDYIETSSGSGIIQSTPLADTLNYTLCNYIGTPTDINSNENQSVKINIKPNPSKGRIIINTSFIGDQIIIRNITGKNVLIKNITSKELDLKLN
jgi:GH18 family chitinase